MLFRSLRGLSQPPSLLADWVLGDLSWQGQEGVISTGIKKDAVLDEPTPPCSGFFRMHLTSLRSWLADERLLLQPTHTVLGIFPESGALKTAVQRSTLASQAQEPAGTA